MELDKLPANFESLPNDILRELLKKLDWKSARNYCQTNKRSASLCKDLWKTKAKEELAVDITKDKMYKDDYYEYLRANIRNYFYAYPPKVGEETADEMSMEIARYLREKYPDEFKIHIISLGADEGFFFSEWHRFVPQDSPSGRKWHEFEKKYSVRPGDIAVKDDKGRRITNIFFHYPGRSEYEIHYQHSPLSQGIFRSAGMTDFMQNMGLTIKGAEYLYNISQLGKDAHFP